MVHLANVLIAAADTPFALELQARLHRHGYQGRIAASRAEALKLARQDHPDIVVLGPSLSDGPALDLAAAIKSAAETADIPVFAIAGTKDADLCARALEVGVDDLIASPLDDAVLMARLRPLVRLSTMHVELRQRAAAARQLGVEARDKAAPVATATGPALLLIGRDLSDLSHLADIGADITETDNLYEAEDLLSRKSFDAAVLVAEDNIEDCLDLCSQIRNNPRLFNLPVLLIAGPGEGADIADAYRRGASRVMIRPVDAAVLRTAVLLLVRRQKLRWAIREALNDSLQAATRDSLTGVHSRAYLERYLLNRIDIARNQQRHLSIVFFYIPNVEGIRRQFGDEPAEHLLHQLGSWIGGLLRAEDLTARFQGNEFCVVLPDTPLAEAEVVMHRIAGVLAYTDFAVKDVYQPVKIWVQVGSTELRPDDSLDSVISRARLNLD